jgi:ABC-type polar amino acid transport system ATPase subunit
MAYRIVCGRITREHEMFFVLEVAGGILLMDQGKILDGSHPKGFSTRAFMRPQHPQQFLSDIRTPFPGSSDAGSSH